MGAAPNTGDKLANRREGLKSRSRKRFLTLFLAIGGDGYPLSGFGKRGVNGLPRAILGRLLAIGWTRR